MHRLLILLWFVHEKYTVRTIIHIIHSMWQKPWKKTLQFSIRKLKQNMASLNTSCPVLGDSADLFWICCFRGWPCTRTLYRHIMFVHVLACFFYYSSLFWLFSFMQIHLRTRCDSMACMACLVQNSRHRNSFLLRQERPSMQRCSMLLQVCRAFSKPQGPLPKMAR